MNITARVTVQVEIVVRGPNWDGQTSVEQLHREGAQLAVKQIEQLCQRHVKLVGTPKVEAIVTTNKSA